MGPEAVRYSIDSPTLRGVVLGFALATLAIPASALPLKLYVSPNGDDNATGRQRAPGKQGPFATIARARDAVRQLRKMGLYPRSGIEIELLRGIYELRAPVELASEDSGTATAPVVYQAEIEGKIRLVGGKILRNWQPVTDETILSKLDPSVRGKIYQADLKALGIEAFGSPAGGGLELFFNMQPMTLARCRTRDS